MSDRQHGERVAAGVEAADRGLQIDQMVSGDLADPERLDLFCWLDESPERWRRCGLAFLEAQSLRDALTALPSDRDAASLPTLRKQDAARPRRLRIVPVAAGVVALLLAFMLGRGSHPEPDVEEQVAEAPGGDVTPRAVDEDRLPDPPDPDETLDQDLVADTSLQEGVAILLLSTGSGDDTYKLSVPVRITDGGVEVLERSAELPEYVRQQWERRGYHVSQQRRTIPLTLNGRRLDVPVDQFLLTYVGRPLL